MKLLILALIALYLIDRLVVFIRFCLEPDYIRCDGGKKP